MPSFRAAWIMAGLTGVGSGAAPLSGSGKTALNAIPIDALSTSRLENFRSRMAFALLTAASRERALVMPATLVCSSSVEQSSHSPIEPVMGAINGAFDAMNSFRDSPRGTLRLSIVRAGAAALQQGKKPVPVATWATPSIVKKMAFFDARIGLFRLDRPVAHHAGGIPQQRAHRAPTVFADRLHQRLLCLAPLRFGVLDEFAALVRERDDTDTLVSAGPTTDQPARSKGASARVMLVRSKAMARPSVEIDSSFPARIRLSSENCVPFSPSSRRKSSYMRETARVALRRSKQAHSASNSLRVFAFIRHPCLFRPGTPAGSSQ